MGLLTGVWNMVEPALTEEYRRNLRTLAEELPRLRLLLEELMDSIKASESDPREGRLIDLKVLLKELGLDEQEI